jgi:hypothetical protein
MRVALPRILVFAIGNINKLNDVVDVAFHHVMCVVLHDEIS